jgi:acetyltransferase-like isoleucine patch superfamily enzyme
MKSNEALKKLCRCGDNVYIAEDAQITRPNLACIGSHVGLDSGFYCSTMLIVGDYVHVSIRVTVIGGENCSLDLFSFSFVAAHSVLVCGSDDYAKGGLIGPPGIIPSEFRFDMDKKNIVFMPFAGIGVNTVVMPGVTLGEGSVVGACSLVTRNTIPWTIYAGTPAKPVKDRPKDKILEYARRLGFEY